MNARRLHFKSRPFVTPGRAFDTIWFEANGPHYAVTATGVAPTEAASERISRETFEVVSVGQVSRLSWRDHATSVSRFTVVSHSDRFAAWLDTRDDTLCVVDAERDHVLHLSWSSLNRIATITVSETDLYIAHADLWVLPLSELAAVTETTTLDITYEVRGADPTHAERTQLQREQLSVTITPAIDPVPGGVRQPGAPKRETELDALLVQLAEAPDDHTRAILVDLWQDAGEPFAPLFARMLAGDEEIRTEALGLVGHYLTEIGYAGGLPVSGTLNESRIFDPSIIDALVADQRLGLFTTLALQPHSDVTLYTRLVTSPRAVALRRIGVPDTKILQALVAAGRTQLTHLDDVKFASKDTIATLANPAFDRVSYVSTTVDFKFVAKQLEWIARDEAGFWRRAPRHLTLFEKGGGTAALAPAIRTAWPSLPLAGITAGTLTLTR
ncbi:MAG: hypothetical protein QM831_25660 [Kofleriaceae bacterium]